MCEILTISAQHNCLFLYYKYTELDMFRRVHSKSSSGLAHRNRKAIFYCTQNCTVYGRLRFKTSRDRCKYRQNKLRHYLLYCKMVYKMLKSFKNPTQVFVVSFLGGLINNQL